MKRFISKQCIKRHVATMHVHGTEEVMLTKKMMMEYDCIRVGFWLLQIQGIITFLYQFGLNVTQIYSIRYGCL